VLLQLQLPAEAVEIYGGMTEVSINLTVTTTSTLDVTVQWRGKTVTRLPESAWVVFAPKVPDQHGWRVDKLGLPVDMNRVAYNGSRSWHLFERGLCYDQPPGANEANRTAFRIGSVDALIVVPGGSDHKLPWELPPVQAINLYNNVWDNGNSMWCSPEMRCDTARFNFRLDFDRGCWPPLVPHVGTKTDDSLSQPEVNIAVRQRHDETQIGAGLSRSLQPTCPGCRPPPPPCKCAEQQYCRPLQTPAPKHEIVPFVIGMKGKPGGANVSTQELSASFRWDLVTTAVYWDAGAVGTNEWLCLAHKNGARVVMDYSVATWNPHPQYTAVLTNLTARVQWISHIIGHIVANGYDGLNLDVEFNEAQYREQYLDLLKDLRHHGRLNNSHFQLSICFRTNPALDGTIWAGGTPVKEMIQQDALDFIIP
jgi:hypothetical protein